jgi:4-methylaminobutanoate oxidase (formaldehyde-forming)
MFGHTLGATVAMGYVSAEGELVTPDYIREGRYELRVNGRNYEAEASLRPFYDPKSERVKM